MIINFTTNNTLSSSQGIDLTPVADWVGLTGSPATQTHILGRLNLSFFGTESININDTNSSILRPVIYNSFVYNSGTKYIDEGIDLQYEDRDRVLASGASQVYTLSTLLDTLPRNNPFLWIKAFLLVIKNRQAGDKLTLSPNTTNGWTVWISGAIPVYRWAGFAVDKTDALPVVPGSNDEIKITNSGSNDITYSLAILGDSQ